MSSYSAFVLTDKSILHEICGPNDRNLHQLEQLFAAPIHVRGNELRIETSAPEVWDAFQSVVGELEKHSQQGHTPERELIQAVFSDVIEQSGGQIEQLRETSIEIPIAGTKVFPKSVNQARLLYGFQENELSIAVGPAGTGKTYLAVAYALSEVLSKRKRKLMLTRPVVEAGENLGYLPGDMAQKISPYLRPLYDAIETLVPPDLRRRMEEQGIIEVAPLAYMRGRSLRDSFIILDEAQNTSRQQIKMFLTRLGENTKAIVTGDVTQIDLPRRSSSGLIHVLNVLRDVSGIHISYLTRRDIIRSLLVQKIIKAYDEYRE